MCSVDWNLLIEFGKLWLEFIKVLWSWPPMALLMLVVFCVLFRVPVSGLLHRTTSASFLGGSLNAAAPTQDPVGSSDESSKFEAPNDQGQENVEAIIAALPQSLREHIGDINVVMRYFRSQPASAYAEYLRTQQHLGFERIYNRIFGTQLRALAILQIAGTLNREDFLDYYKQHIELGGGSSSVEAFIQFLADSGLIRAENSPGKASFRLTAHGEDFLRYLPTQYANWEQRAF